MAPSTAMPEAIAEAQSVASRNFSANLRALAESQPALIGAVRRPAGEWAWTFGRDGSLTALTEEGRWLADCSLPYQAACAMLKSIESRGTVACLLAPVHAAQVRRTLELLWRQQAVIVLAPDEGFLPAALHCHDFAAAIGAGRLFFAVGPDWAGQLTDLFGRHPGLPTPTLFLRPPTTCEAVSQPLIETSQRVFTEIGGARNAALAELAARPTATRAGGKPPRRLCVVASGAYALWADAGAVLADVLAPAFDVRRLDPERPTTASHLALATAVRECDALVTANFARGNVPAGVVPDDLPWVTWATTPIVPDGRAAAPGDRLLVADAALLPAAITAGWHKSQVGVAGWPAPGLPCDGGVAPAGVAIIADTVPLRADIDEETFELSSHMVLWEMIAGELHASPLLAAEDPDGYLTSRMNRLSIGPEAFDRALFINSLVVPAYQQGLARALLAGGLRVGIFGGGWGEIAEFADHAAGPITSRVELLRAAGSAAVLVRATPGTHPHPVGALGRPVVVPGAGSLDALLRAVRQALGAKPAAQKPAVTSLGPELVMTLLNGAA